MFETEYGVLGMVKERQKQYKDTYTRRNVLGACLCVLSAVPLVVGSVLWHELFIVFMLCVTLVTVGIGVVLLVTAGVYWGALQQLLQEGEYSPKKKEQNALTGTVSTVYWLVATAIFLGYSFFTQDWGNSWIVWPIAGGLYGAVMAVCKTFLKPKK